MPAAVKLQKEYGDAIQVVFVESQGTGFDETVRFAMEHGWMGTPAVWTNNRPFSVASRGLPSAALLSPSGEVVLAGHVNASQVEDEIEKMLSRGSMPSDAPKSVERIYKDLDKGKFDGARERALEMINDPGSSDTEADLAAAKQALETIESRLAAKVARAAWLMENGYPERAEEQVEWLEGAVEDDEELLAKVQPLLERMESEEFEAELDAAKDFKKLEAAFYEAPEEPKIIEKIRECAEEHKGTGVAERALQLISFAPGNPGQ